MSSTFNDLTNTLTGGTSVAPQTIASNTTVTGAAVDCSLMDGPTFALITLGDCGDASTVLTVKLTECATSGGTYTDISGATKTFTASASANDSLFYAISTNLRQYRYVKAVATTASGSSISYPISVAVVGRKKVFGNSGYVTT